VTRYNTYDDSLQTAVGMRQKPTSKKEREATDMTGGVYVSSVPDMTEQIHHRIELGPKHSKIIRKLLTQAVNFNFYSFVQTKVFRTNA